jgi:tellurite resistance-related uncharacterized protein
VIRTIDGFHQDEHGDWVADLSCLHTQHVRHQPPFRDRAWVLTEAGRADHLATPIECPVCDRAELPEGLRVVRTIGPFDDETLPAGLRRDHRVADRTWAVLHVLDGRVRFTMASDPAVDRVLGSGDSQAIPPGVAHAVQAEGVARVTVDFMTRS